MAGPPCSEELITMNFRGGKGGAKIMFAREIVRSNYQRLPRPYKLLLGLTYWCNSACLTCNIWKRKPENELSLSEIETFFQKNNHFSWVNLTGGEIFLRSDLPEILETTLTECKDLCLLNFATNGLQPKRTERILAEMPTHPTSKTIVTMSVDGTQKINDKIRGVKGNFKKSVETFRRIRALDRDDLSVYFGVTLSNYNAGQLDVTYEALQREVPTLRREDIHINVAQQSSHYYGNADEEELATEEGILRDVAEHLARQPRVALSPVRFLEKRFLQHLQDYLRTRRNPLPCHSLSASCYVDSFGVVYPCINYDRPLGSLRDVDFELDAIWRRTETKKVQKEIKQGNCPNCWTPCEAYQSILGGLLR